MSMIWLSWVTVVPVWSPCTMTTGASNYCHFPHSMDTSSWSHIPASMRCQFTSHLNTTYCNFRLDKFSSKKYSRKIIFAQTKLNENNFFTSCVWWALIEGIAPHAKEMAGEKEMACCVRGYHVYKDMWAAAIGELLLCHHWCVIGKIFVVKLCSRKIFSYVFCVVGCTMVFLCFADDCRSGVASLFLPAVACASSVWVLASTTSLFWGE